MAVQPPTILTAQPTSGPETVAVHDESITLHGLLWRPKGRGPFPAILRNHCSGRTREELDRLGPYERQAETLGPACERHGYVFLFLFWLGVGLSADQSTSAADLCPECAATAITGEPGLSAAWTRFFARTC